jgi:hypothetical protein
MRLAGSPRRVLTRLGAAALIAGVGGASAACSFFTDLGPQTCDRSESGNPPVLYTEGTVVNGVYMSSDWGGEWLYFPGGMRYRIEHKLCTTPRSWSAITGFHRYGVNGDDGECEGDPDGGCEPIAPGAGNETEVHDVNAVDMTVVNATCSDMWLLVTATAGDPSADGTCD